MPHLSMVRNLLAAVLAVAACTPTTATPDSGSPPDGGTTGCPVAFTHRAVSSASTVSVIGEWNGFDRTAQPLQPSTPPGTWAGTFQVPPGAWAYRFLENGADVADSAPHLVRYVDGTATPALRVADCRRPSLAVVPDTLAATRPSAGAGQFAITLAVTAADAVQGTLRSSADTGAPRALSAAELALSGDLHTATIALSGLSDGKYTLSVQATLAGTSGDALLLPFWVEAEHFTFKDSPLYMALIDRFRDGDPSNDQPGPASPAGGFRGGDLQGLQQSIREGYFDDLHVKAIWVSPWQQQPEGAFPAADGVHTVSGYHGYWPIRARQVDPRFGGNQALLAMVAEAHRHGIRIVMDLAINQVHQEHEYFKDPAKKDWFRPATGKTSGPGCLCGSSNECGWDNARQYCLFTSYLPDINWTNNDAADQFVEDALWWMQTFDLDGIRMDAVKHVEPAAVTNLSSAVRDRLGLAGTEYYLFGESFTGDVGLINSYIGPQALDGQLDFPLFFAVPEPVFARDDNGLQLVKAQTNQSLADFAAATMVTFVGNQDLSRFITKADPANRDLQNNTWSNTPGAPVGQLPYDRLLLAMTHLMTTPGVPLIYYGDEYGEFGGADPDNRHLLNREPSLWAEQRAQLTRMKALLSARAGLRGLRRGPLVDLWCNTEPWGQGQGNLYAYARPDPDPRQSAVVVLNLTGNTWTNVVVNFPSSLQWTTGTIAEALSHTTHLFSNSTVTLDVPAHGAVVLHLE